MRFIDLCAGIGGIRLGLEQCGMKCVFSMEIDKYACQTYLSNFGVNPYGDILKLTQDDIRNIPDFELLAAGFPCQPFSISGKKEGFMDAARGTIFFYLLNIIKERKPPFILLENVAHLLHHQKGYTWQIIKNALEDLGYNVHYQILNSSDYGVPQHRERLFIVCTPPKYMFSFPLPYKSKTYLYQILENDKEHVYLHPSEYTLIDHPKLSPNELLFAGYLNKNTRKKGVRENTLHLSRSHKQPNRIYDSRFLHPTLNASEISGRYFILTENGVRKLTLLECFRLQGFPDDFIKPVSPSQLYKQIGNSVTVPVIFEIGKKLLATVECV